MTTIANRTRKRARLRDRRGQQASQIRTSSEATGKDRAGDLAAARGVSTLDRIGSRGS
jgi:hypothetical protein